MPSTAMTFDERYRAINARDSRFDGQFITAVRSTGIYCRPSCPARTPKPENVTFYLTSAAAHEAGFRACKLCLPEAAPGSPAWNQRSDIAGRAMRLIAEGIVDREGTSGLASRLGYSSRHLNRLLNAELGAGPLALARAQRAQTARLLLTNTTLSAADTAFAAGFSSVRQFNETVQEVFGLTPVQLRQRTLRSHKVSAAPGSITLLLPHRTPIDLQGIFNWLDRRVIEGVEEATNTSYARTLRLPGGTAWFRVTLEGQQLRLEARYAQLSDLAPLVSRVRRLFDLDADPQAVDAVLAGVPELATAVVSYPGMRVPGTVDSAELLIRTMVSQQITLRSARTLLSQLTRQLGERTPEGQLLFPSMTAIAEAGAEVLRGPKARVTAITTLAAELASGELELSSGDDSQELGARLLAKQGIGPWTAHYLRMRVTGDPDVLLEGDAGVRAGAEALGLAAQWPALRAWAQQAAPWRSYLTHHLWRAATKQPLKGITS